MYCFCYPHPHSCPLVGCICRADIRLHESGRDSAQCSKHQWYTVSLSVFAILSRVSTRTTSSTQRAYANKIKPIRKNGHLLLVTLLLANMIVNETLPVIADPVLGGGVQSVVVSTVLIVM